MKTLNIEVLGDIITVDIDGKGKGILTSGLPRETNMSMEDCAFNTGIDIIESMVLAHACAGIDIESPEYIQGVQVAYESLANNLDY